jgi:hypothetical protein
MLRSLLSLNETIKPTLAVGDGSRFITEAGEYAIDSDPLIESKFVRIRTCCEPIKFPNQRNKG